MTISPWIKIEKYLHSAHEWYLETPSRALAQAYDAAVAIKAIEREHFNGGKISPEAVNYGISVQSYFNLELRKYLKIVRMRLVEFNASRSVFDLRDRVAGKSTHGEGVDNSLNGGYRLEAKDKESQIFEKLEFIDGVIGKYTQTQIQQNFKGIIPVPNTANAFLNSSAPNSQISENGASGSQKNTVNKIDTSAAEVSLLPRSLLGTLNRLTRELDPEAEKEVIKNFRNSKVKTIISMRFILLLILIPLLAQQLSKNFIVGPIVDRTRHAEISQTEIAQIFINSDLEEEAFRELNKFEEMLKFRELVGLISPLSAEEKEKQVEVKAVEIAEEYRDASANAIKNVFSDIVACSVFAGIIFTNKRQIDILKSFMDDVVYGLSDSAKAFIIILFTDIFVGFHSPHGWEIILENVSKHLGVPENRDFIFLFIATFPVILDTVFKYWIFRYLNRSSPSAVATYKNMNE
ncbi:MAG TPA: proton extrusion protein PcxA [Kamptonema sp.]|nr:proton extrusion protein PcxA [Kamptonema sp.]